MACIRPATGAATEQYYVLEADCGVTPDNPGWLPLRYTGGVPSITKDFFQSQELDGSREVNDIRGGANQVNATFDSELYYGSHDALFEAALGGTWASGNTSAGLDITVDATAKTFTRDSGDFTLDTNVGDLVSFPDLANGNNNGAFIATSVTPLVLTCANAEDLEDESSVTTGYLTSDKLEVGTTRRSFSILTYFKDADGGSGEYHIAKGVEFTAYTFTVEPNAMVTGNFTCIGRSIDPDTTLPAGSTFPATEKTEPFSGIDGKVLDDDVEVGFVTSATINLDNAAAAQYVVGNNDTAFISQGRANNTLSFASYFLNSDNYSKFINETELGVDIVLDGQDGAYSFTYPRVVYTSGAIEVAGEGDITQALDGQALAGTGANTGQSAITLQRIAKA